jgi:hypothetical protein
MIRSHSPLTELVDLLPDKVVGGMTEEWRLSAGIWFHALGIEVSWLARICIEEKFSR